MNQVIALSPSTEALEDDRIARVDSMLADLREMLLRCKDISP
jgi:hypothetical protein